MNTENENNKTLNDFLSKSDGENSNIEQFTDFNETLNLNKTHIIDALKTVFDPEIPVNIYDLGLIYNIDLGNNFDVKIQMTLTSPNCPVAGEMPNMVANSIKKLGGFKSVTVDLVWEPPWSKEMMSEDAKLALDIS